MSGIPFGLLSETLDARNPFRGMVFGMLPRLPWSGNPVPLGNCGIRLEWIKATMHGYWDENNPVKTDNANLLATVYTNENKALSRDSQLDGSTTKRQKISIDEKALGFHPATISLPEIRDIQWGSRLNNLEQCEIMGRSGMIILLEKMNIPCYKIRYGNRTFSLRFKYKYCNHDKIRNKSLDYFMQKRL